MDGYSVCGMGGKGLKLLQEVSSQKKRSTKHDLEVGCRELRPGRGLVAVLGHEQKERIEDREQTHLPGFKIRFCSWYQVDGEIQGVA
jgi:hypothetical protein